MKQATCAPFFEDPDGAIFTAETRAKILQPTPSTCYGMLISMLSSVVGQDICDVGQSIADLGETDGSQERIWAVGKAPNRGDVQKVRGYPSRL